MESKWQGWSCTCLRYLPACRPQLGAHPGLGVPLPVCLTWQGAEAEGRPQAAGLAGPDPSKLAEGHKVHLSPPDHHVGKESRDGKPALICLALGDEAGQLAEPSGRAHCSAIPTLPGQNQGQHSSCPQSPSVANCAECRGRATKHDIPAKGVCPWAPPPSPPCVP